MIGIYGDSVGIIYEVHRDYLGSRDMSENIGTIQGVRGLT